VTSKPHDSPIQVSRSLLWFAFLGPPLAWVAHIGARYPLVPTACALELPWVLHGITILTLSVTLGATLAAVSIWRRARTSPTRSATVLRIRYMAVVGAMLGVLFAVVIVAELVPALIQDPCLDVRR
jgi:hypothetical protein